MCLARRSRTMLRKCSAPWVLVAVGFAAGAVQAGTWSHLNSINRKLGLGWSAGYHAREHVVEPDYGWTRPASPEVSHPVHRAVDPAPTPALTPPKTPRTSQKPRNHEPILPSQQ